MNTNIRVAKAGLVVHVEDAGYVQSVLFSNRLLIFIGNNFINRLLNKERL